MNTMKIVGVTAAGLTVAALIGGAIWWAVRRRKKGDSSQKKDGRPWIKPSGPPRDEDEDDDEPVDSRPRGKMLGEDDLDPYLKQALDERFPDAWPPDDATVNGLTQEDVVVFAVESEPVEGYTSTRQELVTAKVLSVETSVVRGRIQAPIAHAEHHGSHAGHGFRVGDLVEIPRSKILVAARPTGPKGEGYNSEGKAEETFKPSNLTKTTYNVRPATPYDLVLPYRTAELEWYVDREMVKMVQIGQKGLLEQIMFSEDSMRGGVTVRAIDNDPEVGKVFVARWDFDIAP